MKFNKEKYIAYLSLAGIGFYLVLRFVVPLPQAYIQWPLWIVLSVGGIPLVWDLSIKLFRREFGSDLLAGISIVTSIVMGEYLAGSFVVLMLSGGVTLEISAVRRASSVLEALAKRLPNIAHRKNPLGITDIAIDQIQINDLLVIFPHEICPVDGVVVEGGGSMDESYLTGEPFVVSKTLGSFVLSGAINKDTSIGIRANKLPIDSRYAKIMRVMRAAEEKRPRLRRLADQLGAFYTPVAVLGAVIAAIAGNDPLRFLSVLVVATPCPLLIAIPVAIIGSISLSARRGIVIRNPSLLEQIDQCRTMILDKTGTLTCGKPDLTDAQYFNNFTRHDALQYASSLERYSRHPLAGAIMEAATRAGLTFVEVTQISEMPGHGLSGMIGGQKVVITNRNNLLDQGQKELAEQLPCVEGLECVVLINGTLAAHFQFHDEPRQEGKSFIDHLNPRHNFKRVMIVSGDRESEVRYLARKVGIEIIHAGESPEDKIHIVQRETKLAKTIFLGDGINDAPALTAATVGIAFGQNSDITAEAAGAVILESSLSKVDELMHISRRMRRIALQSAVGGMILSAMGMIVAALGYLPPVAGAITQEIIDILAVLNALRAALPPKDLTDFSENKSSNN